MMWLVFIILLDLYLLVKIIRTFLDILNFFEMKKSARKMAEIWKESIENGCQYGEEDKAKTRPTSYGKHAL